MSLTAAILFNEISIDRISQKGSVLDIIQHGYRQQTTLMSVKCLWHLHAWPTQRVLVAAAS